MTVADKSDEVYPPIPAYGGESPQEFRCNG